MQAPNFLLRDIRNQRRHGTTINQSITTKDIGSLKDLKKARSS
jgi:hypothetical protein